MKKLNEDIFYNLKQISPSFLKEISKTECNKINDNTKEEVMKLSDSFDEIEEKNSRQIIELMSKLDMATMTSFILNIEKVDAKFAKKIINGINNLDKENKASASFVADKLLRVYRINLFSSVFSNKRLQALELALRSY